MRDSSSGNMRMAMGLESCEDDSELYGELLSEERDPNMVEERFRVDRRKLEQMLQGRTGRGLNSQNLPQCRKTLRFGSVF